MLRAWLLMFVLAACGDNLDDQLFFTSDDRSVLCAASLDDQNHPVDWDHLQDLVDTAVAQQWSLLLYAHTPGVTVTRTTLERAFTMFDRAGLAYLPFSALDPDAPRVASVTFAFDDDAVDAWVDVRDLLQAHDARVTFFVTLFAELAPAQRAALHTLAGDGHDIEAHGARHLDAVAYAAEHGIDAYLQDELLPGLAALRDDGFTPDSFAYPFGSRTAALDTAVAPYVRYVRGIAGHCPSPQ